MRQQAAAAVAVAVAVAQARTVASILDAVLMVGGACVVAVPGVGGPCGLTDAMVQVLISGPGGGGGGQEFMVGV